MELALVVYLVNILAEVDTWLGGAVGLIVVAYVIFTIGVTIKDSAENNCQLTLPKLKKHLPIKTFCSVLVLSVLIPTPDTLKYMAGAYLIQTTYESEFVQEAGSLAGKAVTNQLRKWAESNPDIDTLLESVEATKQKAESVAK